MLVFLPISFDVRSLENGVCIKLLQLLYLRNQTYIKSANIHSTPLHQCEINKTLKNMPLRCHDDRTCMCIIYTYL